MKNNNRKVIRKLIHKSIFSDMKRNFFIITAITLTMLLITSVFSIGFSFIETIKREKVRIEGSAAHAGGPNLSDEQIKQMRNLDYVKHVGIGRWVASVVNRPEMGELQLRMVSFDKAQWQVFHVPAFTDIVGNYPQKSDEIMTSIWVLERLGIPNPKVGMEVSLTFTTDSGHTIANDIFVLSGYYTSYSHISSPSWNIILASEEMAFKYNKLAESDRVVNIIFKNETNIEKSIEKLKADLQLANHQMILPSSIYIIDYSQHIYTFIGLLLLVVFIMITGFLLIYNVLYISVSRKVRYYGMLKTIGTTPIQIRHIVIGQVMRLCIVGIPLGALLASIISFAIVPNIMSVSGIETGAIVSFSPIIYVGAAIFALTTVYIGAALPVKNAAHISPVEAVRYVGANIRKKYVYSNANGKPYKMAFRNIFRNRKQAFIVLVSLFLGVTIFLVITTFVSGIDIDKYVSFYLDSDFELKNNAMDLDGLKRTFNDDDFLQRLKEVPGFENMQVSTNYWYDINREMNEAIMKPFLKWLIENSNVELSSIEYEEELTGSIIGIDRITLAKLNENLTESFDLEAFERGDFGLISTDDPNIYSSVRVMEIIAKVGEKTFNMPIKGFVPEGLHKVVGSFAPTIIVSNNFLINYVEDPLILFIGINVAKNQEIYAYESLKKMIEGNYNISLNSRLEGKKAIRDTKILLFALGGGVSAVIGLIGILNFVNVMSVGIMVRKRELAILESIGMSQGQMRKMLISEGIGYAAITILLVVSIGNLITLSIFQLFLKNIEYMVITYPIIPIVIVFMIILTVCMITPKVVYGNINKSTLVERLREAE